MVALQFSTVRTVRSSLRCIVASLITPSLAAATVVAPCVEQERHKNRQATLQDGLCIF